MTPVDEYSRAFSLSWGHAMQRLIPGHMHEGVVNYFVHRIQPGSFLTAVLENKLKESYSYADDVNVNNILNYMKFLYNYAPMNAFGSEKKVAAWLNPGGEK